MSSMLIRRAADLRAGAAALALAAAFGCATGGGMHLAHQAEQAQDYDRAVVEYTKVVRADPANREARTSLDRVKQRAAFDHANKGRRLAALDRDEEAVIEYQLAWELNPTDPQIDAALRDVRQRLRNKIAVNHGGRTELESLIARTRDAAPPGLDLPVDLEAPHVAGVR